MYCNIFLKYIFRYLSTDFHLKNHPGLLLEQEAEVPRRDNIKRRIQLTDP